jgi:hypothetical protein
VGLNIAQKIEKAKLLAAKHRQRCQKSFLEYCKEPELFPNEPPAKHHAFMIAALEGVAAGQIKRLMVLRPRQERVLQHPLPELVSGQEP